MFGSGSEKYNRCNWRIFRIVSYYKSLNQQKYVAALYIDFKKAFDSVDHMTLLQTINSTGINGLELKWMQHIWIIDNKV